MLCRLYITTITDVNVLAFVIGEMPVLSCFSEEVSEGLNKMLPYPLVLTFFILNREAVLNRELLALQVRMPEQKRKIIYILKQSKFYSDITFDNICKFCLLRIQNLEIRLYVHIYSRSHDQVHVCFLTTRSHVLMYMSTLLR